MSDLTKNSNFNQINHTNKSFNSFITNNICIGNNNKSYIGFLDSVFRPVLIVGPLAE